MSNNTMNAMMDINHRIGDAVEQIIKSRRDLESRDLESLNIRLAQIQAQIMGIHETVNEWYRNEEERGEQG